MVRRRICDKIWFVGDEPHQLDIFLTAVSLSLNMHRSIILSFPFLLITAAIKAVFFSQKERKLSKDSGPALKYPFNQRINTGTKEKSKN